MNKDEIISILKEEIEEKNREIDRLNSEYSKIMNSRSWKYANYGRKIYKCMHNPKIILRKLGLIAKGNHYKNYLSYNSIYEDNQDYSKYKTDIKSIAFYLPQFHTFKENDEWWGKGFTEWTNTKKSSPKYPTHYQPREPHDDIGYYDLKDVDVLKKQTELAKQHGLYGFCFYYYWFSGKRLMEKPVDMLLEHKEIDFPFCLCWANENWTRTWDGLDKEVLIAQKYAKDDPKKFIKDIKKYMEDKRYIRIDDKPVLLVYNPSQIPNIENVIDEWRKEAKLQGIGEIYIITRHLIPNDIEVNNSDANYDFPPLQKGFPSCTLTGIDNAFIFNYSAMVSEMINYYRNHKSLKPFYYTSTMGWDNSARRKDGYTVFHNYSLENFYNWNREIIRQTRRQNNSENRIMFINAWNEWCEGTYLDPDKKYGYANINTLSKSIFDIPFNETIVSKSEKKIFSLTDKKIAVQIHLFHEDLTDEIIEQVNNIPYPFDCYITTDTEEKKEKISLKFGKECKANQVIIDVSINRGRDVAPFLLQMSKVYNKYDYICHIHTKKSKTVKYGDDWRKYLYRNLFGSEANVSQIFECFENDKSVGVIFPPIFPVIVDQVGFYGKNYKNCLKEFKRLGIPKQYINEKLVFPAGTMFWAKTDAIKPLFEANYKYSDFAKEKGQLDRTTAHAIERIICTLAFSRGYSYRNIYNNSIKFDVKSKKRLILFAHNDENNTISNTDLEYLQELKKYAKKLVVISSKEVLKNNKSLEKIVDDIFVSDEEYDFNAWSVALNALGRKEIAKYEEIVFANNNRCVTNISFDEIFHNVKDNSLEALCIHKAQNQTDFNYINSDFMILSQSVLLNENVYSLFTNPKKYNSMDEKNKIVNAKIEEILNKENIPYNIYINETNYVDRYLVNGSIDLKSPYLMLILNSPLLDKRSFNYLLDDEKVLVNDFIKKCKK